MPFYAFFAVWPAMNLPRQNSVVAVFVETFAAPEIVKLTKRENKGKNMKENSRKGIDENAKSSKDNRKAILPTATVAAYFLVAAVEKKRRKEANLIQTHLKLQLSNIHRQLIRQPHRQYILNLPHLLDMFSLSRPRDMVSQLLRLIKDNMLLMEHLRQTSNMEMPDIIRINPEITIISNTL